MGEVVERATMPPMTKTELDQINGPDADVGPLVDELDRRGLRAPAALLLEAHRPFLPLLRQLGIFGGPLIGPLIGSRRMAGLQRLLGDPGAFDRLVAGLERGDRPQDDA